MFLLLLVSVGGEGGGGGVVLFPLYFLPYHFIHMHLFINPLEPVPIRQSRIASPWTVARRLDTQTSHEYRHFQS